MNPATARHAAQFLKANDRDRYFATLLVDGPECEAITALYAFNADIASVRDRAREPAAGEIRLQWWVDALAGENHDKHGVARQNPLADALLDAIAAYRLPTAPLTRLIAARRFDLYDDPIPDLPSFEGYAGETNSVLYQLGAMILNAGNPVEAGDAAGHLGVGQALSGHLRAFGFYAASGRLFLPWSIFAANGVNEGEIFAGTISEGLVAALGQIADLAEGHLDKAAAAITALPRPLRPAFAPLALARRQLGVARRCIETPFQPMPDLADWRKITTLWWWKLRNG